MILIIYRLKKRYVVDIKELIKEKIKNDISNFEENGIKHNHGMNKDNIRDYLIEPKLEKYINS